MKRLVFILLIGILVSCGQREQYEKAPDAMTAGTEFIDACLKGQFKKADFYMLPDGENKNELTKLQGAYDHKDADFRQQYRQASILIDHEETLDDSTHVIYYKNSFDKEAHKVKVVRQDGNWIVDLKYTFDGNL